MARPGGNPNIVDHGFKAASAWDGSRTERMGLKMSARMKQALKAGELPNWQEVARRAIARELGWYLPEEQDKTQSMD